MNAFSEILELIGTAAFAISGAVAGLKRKADVFGVLVLAVVTAAGGGVIRDIILGSLPPDAFLSSRYVLVAAVFGLIVFLYAASKASRKLPVSRTGARKMLFYMDTIGLGAFSVMGVLKAYQMYGADNGFLCVFCGVITGTGGGLLRDMMIDQLPDIFRKYVYAVASIAGSFVSVLAIRAGQDTLALALGMAVIFVIRLLAYHFRWNLPKVNDFEEDE